MNRTLPEGLDLNPSFLEVQAAKAIFLKRIQRNARYTHFRPGSQLYMSPEVIVACALAEVWRQGRKFQRDHDTDALIKFARMRVQP